MKKRATTLLFLCLLTLISCNNEIVNHQQKSIEKHKNNIEAILGFWYPISYSGSKGQSLTPSDIDNLMKQTIYFGGNTVKIFDCWELYKVNYSIDTIADLRYYLRLNKVDFDKYEMFPEKCPLIIINGYTQLNDGTQIEGSTDALYNGEYLLVSCEGVSFLCKKYDHSKELISRFR